jgi:hypothetical protein
LVIYISSISTDGKNNVERRGQSDLAPNNEKSPSNQDRETKNRKEKREMTNERLSLGAYSHRVASSDPREYRSAIIAEKRAYYQKQKRIRRALASAGYRPRVERIGEEALVIWS